MVWSDQNVNRFPSGGFRKWNKLKVFLFDLVSERIIDDEESNSQAFQGKHNYVWTDPMQ